MTKGAEFYRWTPGFCPECAEWVEIKRGFRSASMNARPFMEEILCKECGFHWLFDRVPIIERHGRVWKARQAAKQQGSD